MKILIFANANSIHTKKIVNSLCSFTESHIHIISFSENSLIDFSESYNKMITIEVLNSRVKSEGNNFSYILQIPKIIRRVLHFKPDFVISIYLTSYGVLASMLKYRFKLIHIVIGSDGMIAPSKSPLHWFVTWFALLRADLIMAVSFTLKLRLTNFPFIRNKNFFLSQYGVEESLLRAPKRSPCSFISSRALIPNSNIDKIIHLFIQSNCSEELTIVGYQECFYHRELLSLSCGASNIRWVGPMDHPVLMDLVYSSKFFFSLTESDGASLSLMEAMALGCIPIVSSIPANQEWITDGVNGLLIDLDNIDSDVEKFKVFISKDEVYFDGIREINRNIISRRGLLRCNIPLMLDRMVLL
jgi:glycosyltransferase involved in cell wall biosynthesis